MSAHNLFVQFSHTWLSVAMRDSTWGFAIVEVGHLLALAILGGTILILDLRLLGLGLRRQSVSRIAQELFPLLLGSLIFMFISGVLLVATDPMKYYESPAFRLKALLLLLAIIVHFLLHYKAVQSGSSLGAATWTRAGAILSLVLWLGVGVAGRAIGLI